MAAPPHIFHNMPLPVVVPIFWGHDYIVNPATVGKLHQMLLDLVTGPFMNGLAQYGVQQGSVRGPIVIDDQNPPATLTYTDESNQLKDDITKQLKVWIKSGVVPPPSSTLDINQFYLIIPPPKMIVLIYNTADDPHGAGVQGFHNEGITDPAPPPTLYWAIVKTIGKGDPSTLGFVHQIAPTIGHELVEQFVNRNGQFREIGDDCQKKPFYYRGWPVEQYSSEWDISASNPNGCINGDSPVSLKRFLDAIGFDYRNKGLRSLGTSAINPINVDYIARTMQFH